MQTHKKYRKWLRLLFAFYPLVSVLGFLFPFIPRYFINKALAGLKGYNGHLDSIHIAPFGINIKIKGLYIDKVDAATRVKSLFIAIESVEIDISWVKLWSGTVLTSVKCSAPEFTCTKESTKKSPDSAMAAKVPMTNPLYNLDLGFDLIVEKIEISGGKFEFIDPTADPVVDIAVSHIDILVSNISTIFTSAGSLCDIILRAVAYEGNFILKLKANLFSRTPEFSLDADISDVNMVLLNVFFQAYGKFDVSSGIMGMHSEIEATDSRFKGYVESIIKDLHILGPEDRNDNLGRYLWEGLVGATLGLFKDHSRDELAARVNMDQPFQHPEIHTARAVFEVLTNAFVHGLTPYLRNEVKIDL